MSWDIYKDKVYELVDSIAVYSLYKRNFICIFCKPEIITFFMSLANVLLNVSPILVLWAKENLNTSMRSKYAFAFYMSCGWKSKSSKFFRIDASIAPLPGGGDVKTVYPPFNVACCGSCHCTLKIQIVITFILVHAAW